MVGKGKRFKIKNEKWACLVMRHYRTGGWKPVRAHPRSAVSNKTGETHCLACLEVIPMSTYRVVCNNCLFVTHPRCSVKAFIEGGSYVSVYCLCCSEID